MAPRGVLAVLGTRDSTGELVEVNTAGLAAMWRIQNVSSAGVASKSVAGLGAYNLRLRHDGAVDLLVNIDGISTAAIGAQFDAIQAGNSFVNAPGYYVVSPGEELMLPMYGGTTLAPIQSVNLRAASGTIAKIDFWINY